MGGPAHPARRMVPAHSMLMNRIVILIFPVSNDTPHFRRGSDVKCRRWFGFPFQFLSSRL
jgi:hypothetical protein